MCMFCNPVCGRCPTKNVVKRVVCSCGTANYLPTDEKCKNCGMVLEQPKRIKCSYNKMMCSYPCRLAKEPNQSGTKVNCRNVRSMQLKAKKKKQHKEQLEIQTTEEKFLEEKN